MNKTQLTKEGHERLQEEHKNLAEVKKPQAIERLHKARSMGDLSENSEYTAAKEELAFVEGRITEIEVILKNVEIINNQADGATVTLGNKVSVQGDKGTKEDFIIVGEFEADPVERKLSHTSPIGRALLGKKVGETIEIEVPAGKISYKILNVG